MNTALADSAQVNQNVQFVMEKMESWVSSLTNALGIAANKVFPLYVKQAYLYGLKVLGLASVSFLLFAVLLFISIRGYLKHRQWACGEDVYGHTIAFLFACVCFIVFVVAACDCISPLYNPEYNAMQSILSNIKAFTK